MPPRPGILSAVGLLHADVPRRFQPDATRARRSARTSKALERGLSHELRKRGAEWLKDEGGQGARSYELVHGSALLGQNFELIARVETRASSMRRRSRSSSPRFTIGTRTSTVTICRVSRSRSSICVLRSSPRGAAPTRGGCVARARCDRASAAWRNVKCGSRRPASSRRRYTIAIDCRRSAVSRGPRSSSRWTRRPSFRRGRRVKNDAYRLPAHRSSRR